MAPEFERLGETFKSTGDVVIAQIEADKHPAIAKRFGVTGFPTLKWIEKGSTFESAVDVDAERTAAGLVTYVNDKTGYTKKVAGEKELAFENLTPVTFKAASSSSDKHAFVGFFAPWCGHCKALKPTWDQLAQVYADDANVVIGAVDCDEHQDLCSAQGVEGYPTLKYYESGEDVKYEQGRELKDLTAYVNEKTGLDYSVDGGVVENAGVIHEISQHVQQFIDAKTDGERTKVVNTCTEKVDDLEPRAISHFMYYRKLFAKIADKGVDYIHKEKSRIEKVLDTSDSLKNVQRRSFMRRLNVLNVFAQK